VGHYDPRAIVLHRKLGELIVLDYQPVSLVEDVGFIRFVVALEPRYKLPNRKYITETVLQKINRGIKEELMKKLHAPATALLQMAGVQMLLHVRC